MKQYYLFYDGSIKPVNGEQGEPIHYGCRPLAMLTEQARTSIKRLLKQRKEAGLSMVGAGEWALNRARFEQAEGITLCH